MRLFEINHYPDVPDKKRINTMSGVDIGLNGFSCGQVFDFDADQAQVIYEVDKERGRLRIIRNNTNNNFFMTKHTKRFRLKAMYYSLHYHNFAHTKILQTILQHAD